MLGFVLILVSLLGQCLISNAGEWTTTEEAETTSTVWWTPSSSTTEWWTPSSTTTAWWTPTPTTSSYWSTWTPTSTYTTCYTQQNVVVTVTSILPCPVTSTVVYWECCDQCETACQNTPTTTNGGVGTTTVTSTTTTTPYPVETTTSNGMVIVIVDTTGSPVATQSPTLVYEASNDSQDAGPNLWSMGMVLALVATVMILL